MIFDLIERLPGVFHRQLPGNRFVAMDEENTYAIESLNRDSFGFSSKGFSLQVVARHLPRFEIHRLEDTADTYGLRVIRELERFGSQLRDLEARNVGELRLDELKKSFREAQCIVGTIKDEECNGPSGPAQLALRYVLSRADLTGDVVISLDDTLAIETHDRTVEIPYPLPDPLDGLKPTIGMYMDEGELRQLTTASFWFPVPVRNVIDHMKAASALIECGVAEDSIDRLEDLIELLRAE